MTSAVIYIRVSTVDQVDNYSLETQEQLCREYCERLGLKVDRVFREEGESAKTANRTQLQALLKYCAAEARRRDIRALVVYKVDRLARAVKDHTMLRAVLLTKGVQVRAVAETFDDSPEGQFMENMLAAVAQFDNDTRSARTTAGMKEALRHGRWVWRAPIGYLKGLSRELPSLRLDIEVALLVRLAFEKVARGGQTKQSILEEMTALGLVTKNGSRLNAQSFGAMIENPM